MIFLRNVDIREALVGIKGDGQRMSVSEVLIHSCEHGIQLSSGDLETSVIIQGSKIVFNGNGITMQIQQSGVNVHIQNSVVASNDQNGIDIQDPKSHEHTRIDVSNSTFWKNRLNGLQFSSNANTVSARLKNCSFLQNFGHGLYMYMGGVSTTNINITDSRFDENADSSVFILHEAYNSLAISLLMHNNTFSGNLYEAISTDVHYSVANLVISIYKNLFLGHNDSDRYAVNLNLGIYKAAVNISNNSFTDSKGCIYVYGAQSVYGKASLSISNNQLTSIYKSSKGLIKVGNFLTEITYNYMDNITSETIIEVDSDYDHNISNNTFTPNNIVSCFLKINSLYQTDKHIAAKDNYWGTFSLSEIKDKICDFSLDVRRARVVLYSYFSDIFMTNRHEIYSEDEFRYIPYLENGTYIVGGIVYTNITLQPPDGANVIVNRSLIIEDSGSLEFLGHQVIFAEDRGIIVKGMCKI